MVLSSEPTSARSAMGLPVFRLQAGHSSTLSIQSAGPLFMGTHWVGRQIPCAGPDCPACVLNPPRARGFAIALLQSGLAWRPVLVEASSAEWSRLEGFRAMEGVSFAPGMLVTASRRRSNSPLRMEPISNGGTVDEQFTSPWRLTSALAVLFQLTPPKPGQTVSDFCVAARPVVLRQLSDAISRAT